MASIGKHSGNAVQAHTARRMADAANNNNNQQSKPTTGNNLSAASGMAAGKSDEMVLSDILGMLAQSMSQDGTTDKPAQPTAASKSGDTPQKADSGSDAQGNDDTQGAGKGKGKGKGKSGHIPPGLAKKSADMLPDGNPWKAVLQQREDDAAKAKKADDQKKADTQASSQKASQQQTLMVMIMQQMAKMLQNQGKDQPKTDSMPKATTDPAPQAATTETPPQAMTDPVPPVSAPDV